MAIAITTLNVLRLIWQKQKSVLGSDLLRQTYLLWARSNADAEEILHLPRRVIAFVSFAFKIVQFITEKSVH